VVLAGIVFITVSCGGQPVSGPDPTPTPPSGPGDPVVPPTPPTGPVAPPPGSPVFVGAGDIAPCDNTSPAAGPANTARLLDSIPGAIFTLGDHAYPTASREYFEHCYHPTWGRHRGRTRATIGNHEYEVPRAEAYFEYFGERAGPAFLGYYSFTVGSWLVLSLDSMNNSSAQTAWLRATLAGNRSRCTVALFHHPFVASGGHVTRPEAFEFWRILSEHGVDMVLTAHEHFYERFAPLNADGVRDPDRGMRQFVVGTGGAPLYGFTSTHPASEARASVHGVMKLTLGPESYAWEFVSVSGTMDSGVDTCH
jgi:hypothetical protein